MAKLFEIGSGPISWGVGTGAGNWRPESGKPVFFVLIRVADCESISGYNFILQGSSTPLCSGVQKQEFVNKRFRPGQYKAVATGTANAVFMLEGKGSGTRGFKTGTHFRLPFKRIWSMTARLLFLIRRY